MSYQHLVEITEDRQLTIYRIYVDGRRELFTKIKLPTTTADQDKLIFAEFCRMLGENLMIDSPTARKLLRI
jgi:hypothetical protein